MNSALKDTEYEVPSDILNDISISLQKYRQVNTNGKKRANYLIKFKKITYQNLKRIKNYFDTLPSSDYDSVEFELNGGLKMKNWVNQTLESERKRVESGKTHRTNYAGMSNQFNKEHFKNNLPKVDTRHNFIMESVTEEYNKKVSLGLIVFNSKILLLKRRKDDSWGADKWALVGGGIEKGEFPKEAIIRELKEETELDVDTIIFKKAIVNEKNIEHLFLIKSVDDNVVINEEHQDFKWLTIEEIAVERDLAPQLMEYIRIMLK